jgi:hypothetical protein
MHAQQLTPAFSSAYALTGINFQNQARWKHGKIWIAILPAPTPVHELKNQHGIIFQ